MKTVWYKEPWAWALLAVPVATVVASFYTYYLAQTTNHDMVVDDYYKKGKAINMQLHKIQEARVRKLSFNITFAKDHIELVKASGRLPDMTALKLSFYHPTIASKDRQFMLTADANGIYRVPLEQPLTGKWTVTIAPFDELWKISQTVSLPRQEPILFKP